MTYIRPKSDHKLSPEEKRELLQEYFDYYHEVSITNSDRLNSKLPRSDFDGLLNEIGDKVQVCGFHHGRRSIP